LISNDINKFSKPECNIYFEDYICNMDKIKDADIIKARLIDSILSNSIPFPTRKKDVTIGQEVMYGTQKLFADLVVLSGQKLIAIEIKAYNDSFKRLKNQLEGYRRIFDYVYVVVTENHIEKLLAYPDKWFGILVMTNKGICSKRKAKLMKEFSKEDILETIPIAYLKMVFQIKSNKLAIDIRKELCMQSMAKLKNILFSYMQHKIAYKFQNFECERGKVSHFEDVSILSMSQLIILR